MNLPNLLLHINITYAHTRTHRILASLCAIIRRRRLLPSRRFLFAYRQACRAVEEVRSLRGKTLKVIRDVLG